MKYTSQKMLLILFVTMTCLVSGCDRNEATQEVTMSDLVAQATAANGKTQEENANANSQPSAPQQTELAPELKAEFKAVDLDRFIEQEKKASEKLEGKKLIMRAVPVQFVATIKRLPEQKKLTYIYTALEVAKVSPLPDVEHQMFVQSKEGQIISVYVEKRAATRLSKEMTAGKTADFFGYHVYTYKRGPAILVADFVPTSK